MHIMIACCGKELFGVGLWKRECVLKYFERKRNGVSALGALQGVMVTASHSAAIIR